MEYIKSQVMMAYPKSIASHRHFVLETTPGDSGFIVEDERLLWALQQIPDGAFSKSLVLESWSKGPLSEGEALEIWGLLEDLGGILKESTTAVTFLPELSRAPASYHKYSRSYPFMYMAKTETLWDDNGLMIEYSKESQMPAVWLELPHQKRIHLAKAESELDRFSDDRPHRVISSLEKIAFILDFCAGVRFKGKSGFNKELHFLQLESLSKTVPSGGGKHPTELAFIATNVEGLPQGAYHYNVRENSLDLLNCPIESILYLLDPTPYEAIGYILVLSKLERAMWRYREPRSWRAVMIDAGHIVHSLETVAKTFDLSCDRVTDFSAGALSDCLGLNPEELPLLAAIKIKGT